MTKSLLQPSEEHFRREEAFRSRMALVEVEAKVAEPEKESEIAGNIPQFPTVSESNKKTLKAWLGEAVLSALDDPMTTDVMLNDNGWIFQKRRGEKSKRVGLMSYTDAMSIIHFLAGCYNMVANDEKSILTCEIPLGNGPRIECQVPPTVPAPTFSIRKKAEVIYTLDDYVKQGVLTGQEREAVGRAVSDKKNILVIGGTGSGKTTLVNALLHEMSIVSPDDRLVIIEDTMELQTTCLNRLFLRTSMHVTFDHLLETTLRSNPDRIILGEVRGKAAYSLVKAWNTGHSGGAATIHSNDNCMAGIKRMKTLVSAHEDSPEDPSEDIALAIDVLINIQAGKDIPGGRRVREIKVVDDWSSDRGFVLRDMV